MSLAFKEWHAVVGALVAGRQNIILRKGGIAEGKGGFQLAASRFWLLPTRFHAQAEKLIPAAAPFLGQPDEPERLTAYAELIDHRFLTSWAEVETLRDAHIWTTETLRERFNWSQPPGIHLLRVDVYRLHTPVPLPSSTIPPGCKSWVEIPFEIENHRATRVTSALDS